MTAWLRKGLCAVLCAATSIQFAQAGATFGMLPVGALHDMEPLRIFGRATKVLDGDTFKMRIETKVMRHGVVDVRAIGEVIEVHVHGIDAPEPQQSHAREAKAALAKLVLGKLVKLAPTELELGQADAFVAVEGQNVAAELLAAGHVWVSRQPMKKNDRWLCLREADARKAGLGLWKVEGNVPLAPWEFRAFDAGHAFTDYLRETSSDCINGLGKQPGIEGN